MPEREHANDIEDDATVWAAKAERGLTTDERAALDAWLEGDSRRLGAFVRAQAAWIHAERAVALGKMPEAEAAALAQEPSHDQPEGATLNRRMILGGGAAIAASVAVAAFIGLQRYRTLESGVGEIRHIALAGGTTLTLDTDTRVDIAASSDDRKLALKRGKLFLDVAQRVGAPLSVEVGNLIMETAEGGFSVQSLINDPIMAFVTKGQLAISQQQGLFGRNRTLTVGQDQALTLPTDQDLLASDVKPITAAQREQLLAWRDGMLSFGGEALAQAVRAFDRYGTARIIVADPELARQRITGLFKADDPKGFATAIAASLGGLVSSEGNVVRIYAKKVTT